MKIEEIKNTDRLIKEVSAGEVRNAREILDLLKLLSSSEQRELLNRRSSADKTALHIAVEQGQLPMVELLLQNQHLDRNIPFGQDMRTPLHWACEHGHLLIVKELLSDQSVAVSQTTAQGNTALMMAALHHQTDMAELLLTKNDPNHQNQSGLTVLDLACEQGDINIVCLLLKDTRVSINPKKETELRVKANTSEHALFTYLLLNQDINVSTTSKFDFKNAVKLAAERAQLDIVRLSLEDEKRLEAIYERQKAIAKLRGQDWPNDQRPRIDKIELATIAIRYGQVDVLEILDLDFRRSSNVVMFASAFKNGNAQVNQFFLNKITSNDIKPGYNHSTAIDGAIQHSNFGVACKILNKYPPNQTNPKIERLRAGILEKGTIGLFQMAVEDNLSMQVVGYNTYRIDISTALKHAAVAGDIRLMGLLMNHSDIQAHWKSKVREVAQCYTTKKLNNGATHLLMNDPTVQLMECIKQLNFINDPLAQLIERLGQKESINNIIDSASMDFNKLDNKQIDLLQLIATFDPNILSQLASNYVEQKNKVALLKREFLAETKGLSQKGYEASQTSKVTQLSLASQLGHLKFVSKLSAGLSLQEINSKDAQGHTALHHAIVGGHWSIAEILIDQGADPDIKNRQGQTATTLGADRLPDQLLNQMKRASMLNGIPGKEANKPMRDFALFSQTVKSPWPKTKGDTAIRKPVQKESKLLKARRNSI